MGREMKSKNLITKYDRGKNYFMKECLKKSAFIEAEANDRFEESGRRQSSGFTLIELIVVMAVIGILVLLAAPKFIGYTDRARETKHIHTAKVIETALEAYLINGGAFPDNLEVVDTTLLKEAANKETLIGVNGYVTSVDEEVYYELTYDFIQKLDVKLSAKNALLIEANASSVPTAVYASEKGIALVDKEKTMKDYELQPGELPVEVDPDEIIQVAAGTFHSLGLKRDGTVWAWGNNGYRQLGMEKSAYKPTVVPGIADVVKIAAGEEHSVALKNDGTVWTWGRNQYGQLGDGTNTNRTVPTQVKNLTDVIAIDTRYKHVLALKSDGTVWAWGENNYGKLGDDTTGDKPLPVQVKKLANIVAISTGVQHSLALKQDGTVWAWGFGNYGQLGVNSMGNRYSPVQVQNLTRVSSIASGAHYSMALKEDGTVWTWGMKIGLMSSENNLSPIQVNGLSEISAISSGYYHAFALKNTGAVWGWGQNVEAQLGNGYTNTLATPTEMQNFSDIALIIGEDTHSLAIKKDGTVWSWGKNSDGQLGDGSTSKRYTPTLISFPPSK